MTVRLPNIVWTILKTINIYIYIHVIDENTNMEYCWLVVSGTIAPPRKIPDITAEDTIRIIISNMNLVVPVVAAILVIIIAIIVICILRSKGNHHKGTFYFICLLIDVCISFCAQPPPPPPHPLLLQTTTPSTTTIDFVQI